MKIRCKFVCISIQKYVNVETVKMVPVQTGSEENKSFSQFTPAGSFEINVSNTSLFGTFIPGKEYYIDVQESDINQ